MPVGDRTEMGYSFSLPAITGGQLSYELPGDSDDIARPCWSGRAITGARSSTRVCHYKSKTALRPPK